MGILTNVKNFMGFGELDEYDEYDEQELDEIYEEEDEEEPKKKRGFDKGYVRKKKESNVIPITSRNDTANVQILKPQVFEDSYKIANVIKSGLVAIFDVAEMADCQVATRVVDFVSGTVYALNGNMRKVTDGIFIAAPKNVDISGDTIGEHTRNNFNWDYAKNNNRK